MGSTSVSSATNGGFSNTMRFTGLASGLDVDSIVKQLMQAEEIPYNKLLQKQQVEQWTMDAYRDMSSQLSGFQSTFFDNLNPSTNMLSDNTFKVFSNTVTGASSTVPASVSVTTNADASVGSHSINVSQLATTAKITSSYNVCAGQAKSIASNSLNIATAADDTLNLGYDGGTSPGAITIATGTYDLTDEKVRGDLINNIQSQVNSKFGAGKIAVNMVKDGDSSYRLMITSVDSSKDVNVISDNAALGLKAGNIKTINDSTTLGDLYSSTAAKLVGGVPSRYLNFSINGTNVFSTDLDMNGDDAKLSIDDLVSKVNSSAAAVAAGVKMSYDNYQGKFTFESSGTGATNIMNINNSSSTSNDTNWLQCLGIAPTDSVSSSAPAAAGQGGYFPSSSVTITGGNNGLSIQHDGASPVAITLTAGSYNLNVDSQRTAFLNDIQSKLDASFTGSSKITANIVSEKDAQGNSQYRLMLNADDGADIIVQPGTGNAAIGFSTAATTAVKTITGSTKMSDVASNLALGTPSGTLNFSINGQNVFASDFDLAASGASTTLDQFITSVNASAAAQNANVTMSYDSSTGKFKFANNSGTTTPIVLKDSSSTTNSNNWLQKMGVSSAINVSGKDAVATIDGITMSNSQNTITVNGVSYKLLSTGVSSVSVTNDIDSVVKNVKNFIDKYNTLIANINTKLTDKYDRNYQPLTDDQKAAMKDSDITAWNTKAQTGLLHNDDVLQSIVDNMRAALSDAVPGTSETLHSLGIDTSDDWTQNGKLLMPDDSKLRAALQRDPDGVVKLFTAKSSVRYNPTSTDPQQPQLNQQRYNENGLMNRINDILNNAVRTTNGKGDLLQKAGMKNDASEYDNIIFKQMKDTANDITDMKQKLTDKENAYYTKFSNLETYMNNMNNQSSWLTQQISKM